MKISIDEGFKPVTITLESQEEVNIAHAIANNSAISSAVGGLTPLWVALDKHVDDEASDRIHKRLQAAFKSISR